MKPARGMAPLPCNIASPNAPIQHALRQLEQVASVDRTRALESLQLSKRDPARGQRNSSASGHKGRGNDKRHDAMAISIDLQKERSKKCSAMCFTTSCRTAEAPNRPCSKRELTSLMHPRVQRESAPTRKRGTLGRPSASANTTMTAFKIILRLDNTDAVTACIIPSNLPRKREG